MDAGKPGGNEERDSVGAGSTTTPAVRAGRRPLFADGMLLAGRYRVVRHIASGGMGAVYEVEDLELRERVALKAVHARATLDLAAVERFRREIQLARKITHANVCRIFDVGFHPPSEVDAVAFLTMELLPGESLAERLLRVGRIATDEALPLAEQLVAGLAAAHRAGGIHRDFKSQNIMLVPDGAGVRAVVTDFGLAKAAGGASEAVDTPTITGVGTVLGTPAYMAPEQMMSSTVNERTDIYALGVVLFEMVTGRLPFAGKTTLETVALTVQAAHPPSPASIVPGIDTRWVAAIQGCVAREPSQRFASVDEVLHVLHGEVPSTIAAAPRPRSRVAFAALAAAGLVAAAAVVWRYESTRVRAAQSTVPSVPAPRVPQVTQLPAPSGTSYERGVEFLRRWQGLSAKAALEDAVAAAPRDPRARVALCQALIMSNDTQRALAEAELGLALEAVPAPIRRLLAACRASAAGDDAGAAAIYAEQFAATPELKLGLELARSQLGANDGAGLESTVTALRTLPRPARLDARIDFFEGEARGMRGDFAGERDLAKRASERAARQGLLMVQAVSLGAEAGALRKLGELQAALVLVQQARKLYAQTGERWLLADLLSTHSTLLYDLGEHHLAIAVNEELVEVARQARNTGQTIFAMMQLGASRFLVGDHERGRRDIEEAAPLARNDVGLLAFVDFFRSWERLHAGDGRAAVRLTLASSPTLTARATDRYWVAYYEWELGESSLLAGDLVTARRAFEKAIDVASGSNFRTAAECTRMWLAATALAEGKPAAAEVLARRAVVELKRMGVRDCQARGLVVLARALRSLGRLDAAHAVLVEVAALAPSVEDVSAKWDLGIALAEDELATGHPAAARFRLEAILAEARELHMDDAALVAAVALGELELAQPATLAQGKTRLTAAWRRAKVMGRGLVEQRAQAALAPVTR